MHRQAFEDWLGPNAGRSSWDPITVVAAVRGASGVHCQEVDNGGYMTLTPPGYETWHESTGHNQSRQLYTADSPQAQISFELNQLLCKPPGDWSKTNWIKAAGQNCYGSRGTSPAHGATDLERPGTCMCACLHINFPASVRSERRVQFYIMYLGEGVPKRYLVSHMSEMCSSSSRLVKLRSAVTRFRS